jgi:L-glyceraldehyde 3-phosphate reductase
MEVLDNDGIGSIVFSPLAQGLLTNRYLDGIPEDSRAAKSTSPFLSSDNITKEILTKIKRLNELAQLRNQSLAQMAIAWLLKDDRVTSVLVGASSTEQLFDNVGAIKNIDFSKEELHTIEEILK